MNLKRVPLMLDICRRRVVVVGGGVVAARKVALLRRAGARVIVVSPTLGNELQELASWGRLRWWARCFEDDDCRCATFVVAATNDEAVNRRVSRAARRHGAIAVNCSAASGGLASFAATVSRGELTLAVSTNGTAPALARYVRDTLAETHPPAWAAVVTAFGRLRTRLKAMAMPRAVEATLWRRLCTEPFIALLLAGCDEEFTREVEQCISSSLE